MQCCRWPLYVLRPTLLLCDRGCLRCLAAVQVKDGKTFLDLIAEQVKLMREQHGCKIPFILMDSFSTSEDTRTFLSKAHKDLLEVCRAGLGRG